MLGTGFIPSGRHLIPEFVTRDVADLPMPANASLLDEGTAAAEAMTLVRRANRSAAGRFVVDADALPQTHALLASRAAAVGIELVVADPTKWLGMEGGGHVPEDEIRDPAGAHPALWFQDSGDEEPRQRWHLDVWVDPEQVQGRLDAALAAGGQLVSDAEAPSFWVLADPEGNKVCLCTWQDRDAKGWE